MKIKTKVVLSFFLISLCPLFVSGIVFYFSEKQRIQYQITQHLESVASIQHARILNIYNQSLVYLRLMISRTQLKIFIDQYNMNQSDAELLKISEIIIDAKNALDEFKNITVYSAEGHLISSTKSVVDNQDNMAFEKGLTGTDASVFGFHKKDGLLIHLSGPMYLNGELIGVIVIEYSINNLLIAINDYTGLGDSGETILATRDSNNDAVFLTPTRFLPNAALNLRISEDRTDIPIINATNGEEKLFFDSIDYRDTPVLAVTRHIDKPHWGIVVKIDKKEAFAALTLMQNTLVITITIVALLSIIFIFWISNKLTAPLVHLTRIAQSISNGDLTKKADENVRDEFGLFAKTFNAMTTALLQNQADLFSTIKQLKNKNEEIYANSERFKRWKESNFIGIVHIKIDGVVLDVNDTFTKMLGYSRSEMISEKFNWKKLTPREYFEKSNAAISQAKKTGYYTGLVKEYFHKDGHRVPVIVGASIYEQSNNEYIIFIIDLSEQKKVEQALRENEEQLSTTLHSIGDAVIATNIDGEITQINPVAEQLTGWTSEGALGRKLSEVFNIINSKTRQIVGNPVEKVLASRGKIGLANHTILLAKSGEEFQIADSAAPIINNEGKIIGVVLVFRDISSEYRLQELMEKSEKQYKNLFEHNDVSIWDEDFSSIYEEFEKLRVKGVTDLKSYLDKNPSISLELAEKVRITHVNLATLKLFGASSEKSFLSQIKSSFGKNALNIFVDELCAIWNGDDSFKSEVNLKSFSGDDVFAIISFNVPHTKEEFKSIPVTTHDITQLKNTQVALKKNEEILMQSQKMDSLGKLTGGIAHDYNNMLGVILGYSELLIKLLADQTKLKNYAHQIHRAAERGAKLTSKLLSFSRQKPAHTESVDINELLKSDEDMLQKTLTATIDLELNLARKLWFVLLDPASFQDMLLNLCINAYQAMDSGGKLIILTSNRNLTDSESSQIGVESGDYVCLTIEDNGLGMTEAVSSRIFEPFFSTKKGGGTGLGLSQVYGFVKTSSGAIEVRSKLRHGTCFTIYFPRDKLTKEIETDVVVKSESSYYGNESILVVDDEEALCQLAEVILKEKGYRVFTALGGEKALEILSNAKIDVLLTDIIMPNMTGYQLAKKASMLYPKLLILFASGFQGEQIEQNIHLVANQPIIDKPYNANTLLSRVRGVLDQVDDINS